MGLDAVELIIKIEERFKTQIPDKQAEKIQTVGELYNLLIRRIYQLNSTSCLTASTFYSIRKILLDQYCLTRQDVKPDSLLDDLITQDKRAL